MRYQGVVTDARGYYRFNTIGGGRHYLSIAALVSNDSKFPGSSAELEYEFNLKNGRLRNFKTAIDEDFARPNRAKSMVQISEIAGRGSAVVQGVAVSEQTGKPLAGVPMVLAYGKSSWQSVTDARGYFHFNARPGRYILRAKNGAPLQTFDLAKGQKREFDLTLGELPARDVADVAVVPSASKKAGSAVVQGVVTSKRTGKPLAGVPMSLTPKLLKQKPADKVSSTPNLRADQETVTDMRGYFRFNAASGEFLLLADRQILEWPGNVATRAKTMTVITGKAAIVLTAKQGQKQQFNFALNETNNAGSAVVQGIVTAQRTKTPVAGARIVLENGGTSQKSVTDARGYFRFNTKGGKQVLSASVRAPNDSADSKFVLTFELKNGKKRDLNLDLYEMFNKQGMINSSAVTRALIGQIAPEIQAFSWANGKAAPLSSLRGKVVLLAFQDFTAGDKKALSDFARSSAATARVIGIQINTGRFKLSQPNIDTAATRLGFPIAIDAPRGDGNGIGGYTLSAYGFGITGIYGYAVVGRDGKIIYASEDLQSAIHIASL